jgi:hypothetical protein
LQRDNVPPGIHAERYDRASTVGHGDRADRYPGETVARTAQYDESTRTGESGRGFDVSSDRRVGTETLLLLLTVLVVGLLVGVGALQVYLSGDTGALARNFGIGLILLVFSAALYWQWSGESSLRE